ncbi:hypothetical protein VVCECT4999_15985 [Vibrio vulnificus]|nr:hypothetical protein VVCECT4999_15985 [Vibrio vulnificus]EGR0351342.1 hypothetical protein [Vibrio vulnificus]EGR0639590.1 hypothetical protein [Vibrio vulnificus]EGR0648722.1 hypothetical protein [Vibrio vulnificus]EID4441867.1 hypothetical protein [Vibrio vulnificus]
MVHDGCMGAIQMAMVAECWQTIARHFLTSLLVIYSHRQQHWLRVIDDGENYVKRGGFPLYKMQCLMLNKWKYLTILWFYLICISENI